jgi:hypothetical protein
MSTCRGGAGRHVRAPPRGRGGASSEHLAASLVKWLRSGSGLGGLLLSTRHTLTRGCRVGLIAIKPTRCRRVTCRLAE